MEIYNRNNMVGYFWTLIQTISNFISQKNYITCLFRRTFARYKTQYFNFPVFWNTLYYLKCFSKYFVYLWRLMTNRSAWRFFIVFLKENPNCIHHRIVKIKWYYINKQLFFALVNKIAKYQNVITNANF